jgi:hypothetical protein
VKLRRERFKNRPGGEVLPEMLPEQAIQG